MKSVLPSHLVLMRSFLLGVLFSVSIASFAKDKVTVTQAWVRPTVQGQEVTGAFMTLQSAHHARLVKAESEAAEIVEIHSMTMQNGVMLMRQLKELELPPGKQVKLAPGGYHVMLINVKKQLHEGDTVILTLTILNDDKTTSLLHVNATVANSPPLVK